MTLQFVSLWYMINIIGTCKGRNPVSKRVIYKEVWEKLRINCRNKEIY